MHMHANTGTCTYMLTTKLNRSSFSKKGWKIVNDLSFRIYRVFYSPGALSQKIFDRLRPEDIIQSLDLKVTKKKQTMQIDNEFDAAADEKNESTKTGILIKR